MARGKARQIIFRIFYSTSFTAVFLLLLIFTAVTPADTIYESYKRNRLIDIFLIAGVYVVTALFAALIYASRIYTNRSVLKDIPKTFMPIEKEDLPGRRVHRLIEECLERSAVIAYQARPRSNRIEHDTINAGMRMLTLTKTKSCTDQTIEPSWGKIAHPGWSSPASKELPGLEYATVVDELVDLVEAKAVSLAPVDELAESGPDGMPLPDPRVIEGIARSGNGGMRAYLRYLIDVGVVPDNSLTVAFLAAYERARFSSEPLSDEDFQALMRMFAELLRSMTPVDVELLDLKDEESEYTSHPASHPHSETSSLVYQEKPPHTSHADPETASVASTYSISGSVRRHKAPPRRISEDSAPSLSSFERELQYNRPSSEFDTGDEAHHEIDRAPEGAEDNDGQSLHSTPTTTTTPRPRSRPRPPLQTSSTRMYSAVSRLPPHSDDSSSLHTSSDTGSVVRHDLDARRPSPSRSPRRRTMDGTQAVIRLATEDENGPGDSDNGLPYRIELPQRE